MNRLFIVAGGGGDALMAKILSDNYTDSKNYFMTIVWERKMFDPRPGPRNPDEFISLEKYKDYNYIINEKTSLSYDGTTFIPRLCSEIKENFFLIDLSKGVIGFKKQINELVSGLKLNQIFIIDSGGDVLAKGDEETLKSPLADSFVLSSCSNLSIPAYLLVAGLGLDGELSVNELQRILDELENKNALINRYLLTKASVKNYTNIFNWFPSEVTGMTALVAQGYRGIAEIRDRGFNIHLNDFSNYVYEIKHQSVCDRNIIAQKITNTNDLESVEKIIYEFSGKSEIEYERKKVKRIKKDFDTAFDYLVLKEKLFEYSRNAKSNGIDCLSLRRVGEILGLSFNNLNVFKEKLGLDYPENYKPPIWICE